MPPTKLPGLIQRVAVLGNHTPRQCGIATFTADLHQALASRYPTLDCFVTAMNDRGKRYAYPPCVRIQIDQEEPASYRRAAESLNARHVDILSLQHEYGIFGGDRGAHILTLLRDLRMPVVTTLHTILSRPDERQWSVMDELIRRSERLVVMSTHGADLLRQLHHVPAGRIELIPHGIPTVPFESAAKARLGFADRPLILTFGLLAPDKGLEHVLEAMPAVLARHPDALYLVVGATHPHVKAEQGEAYREGLEARVRALGIEASVQFHNHFVSLDALTDFIAAADLYITPYLKAEQSTSGTLAYAVGSGRAVISTPYWYARELLAQGRGVLVPWRDAPAIAREVLDLLGDEGKRLAMRRKAADLGRSMRWPAVAKRYLEVFQQAVGARALQPVPHLPEPRRSRPALRLDGNRSS